MSQGAWNLLAGDFEDSVCDITATSGDSLAKVIDRVAPSRRQILVDAGCGIGTFTQRFAARFGRVVAFDFASQMVQRARGRCRQLKHVTWHTLPLEDAAQKIGSIAHLAVCLNVITSPDTNLRNRQWESLAGIVRPGGYLLVVVPARESAQYVSELEGHGDEDLGDLIRRTDSLQKHYSRSQLRSCVAREGLRVISLRRIHYPWAEDGVQRASKKTPWDWLCLAGKPQH